jgi:hypothetical protein
MVKLTVTEGLPRPDNALNPKLHFYATRLHRRRFCFGWKLGESTQGLVEDASIHNSWAKNVKPCVYSR